MITTTLLHIQELYKHPSAFLFFLSVCFRGKILLNIAFVISCGIKRVKFHSGCKRHVGRVIDFRQQLIGDRLSISCCNYIDISITLTAQKFFNFCLSLAILQTKDDHGQIKNRVRNVLEKSWTEWTTICLVIHEHEKVKVSVGAKQILVQRS